MRYNKKTTRIFVAISVAILATMISYATFNNMHRQVVEQQKVIASMQQNGQDAHSVGDYAYAVARSNLKAGEIVSDQDVDFQQFDIENKDGFDNRSSVVNKVLLKDISSGETFTHSHIAQISNDNVSLRDGYRALTLPADSFQGRSDTMKPGSFVDIYSVAEDSSWILENVRLVSFASGGAGASATQSSSTASAAQVGIVEASEITFEVSASDISGFISNVSKGKLMLVTRNPNDRKSVHKKAKSVSRRSYSGSGAYSELPDLPSSVPISNFPGSKRKQSYGGSGLSGLPQPMQPVIKTQSVEVIEANVKSKVTF